MKNKPSRIICFLAAALLTGSICAANDFSQEVVRQHANPSPVDQRTGSSINQFGAHDITATINPVTGLPTVRVQGTNSAVDNYLFQDDQLNLKPDSGQVRRLLTNQKINMNQFVPLLIPLKKADPRELLSMARGIVGLEGGSAEAVYNPKKKRHYIYVVAPPFQVPFIKKAFASLDQEWVNTTDSGVASAVYKAKNRDIAAINRLAIRWPGGDGTVNFDLQGQSVWYLDDPDLVDFYLEGAETVDVPVNEITVEATFYEVDLKNDLKLGLDYIAWKNGPGRTLFDFIFAGSNNVEHFQGASSIFNPQTPPVAPPGGGNSRRFERTIRQRFFSYNFFVTAAYIDFLQTKGRAKVLARPVITAVSGTLASWSTNDPVVSFVVTGDSQKTLFAQNGRRRVRAGVGFGTRENLGQEPIGQVVDGGDLGAFSRFLNFTNVPGNNAGIFLNVQPFVGTLSTEMFVNARVISVTGVTPQGLPIMADRAVTTDVRTRNGQQFLLAGLSRTEDVRSKAGAPLLSRIPVLGYLFGGETNVQHETDVVLTIDSSTKTGATMTLDPPEKLKDAIAMVKDGGDPDFPDNPLGFDQWLLDDTK